MSPAADGTVNNRISARSAVSRTPRPAAPATLRLFDGPRIDIDQGISSDNHVVDRPVLTRMAGRRSDVVGSEDNRQPVFDIRSGDILAGNFASVVNQWSAEWPDGAAKIYWVPFDHRVAATGPLEVTVEPLDTSDPPVIQTFEQLASNAAGVFWPTGTKFPQSGRYRLTATAPGHWGCFELTV